MNFDCFSDLKKKYLFCEFTSFINSIFPQQCKFAYLFPSPKEIENKKENAIQSSVFQ